MPARRAGRIRRAARRAAASPGQVAGGRRDASEGQPNGIGFYGLVRNVRDAALASIDAGGDFVAVGKDVSRAILGASMPSARAAWSIASDIATRTAASAAEKGLRCPARHMLASGAEGAARAAAPSRGAGR